MSHHKTSHLVSVIIPVYNCEKYLAEAIESVLAQTYQTIEIIVTDDGSVDGSAAVASRFGNRIRYDFGVHEGLGVARNRGVNLARGEFLAFLDADDLWTKNKLEHQMVVLNDNPQIDMVFGFVMQFTSAELKSDTNINNTERIMKGFHAGCMLIRKGSYFRAGPFDTNWRVGEFIDWYLKATEAGLKSITLQEVIMKRRIHADNTVIRERNSQNDYVRILKASLDRRRKKGNSSCE